MATVPLLQLTMSAITGGENLAFFGLPVGFGLVQILFLRRKIRLAWLWPVLTVVGFYLAMILGLGWFWIPAIGLGFGVAQLPLLLGRGFRFAPLWTVCSGLGWVAGFFLNPLMDRVLVFLTSGAPSSSPAFWAIYFPGALTYSAATGCYLYFCSPQPTGASKHPSAINADEPKTVLT
ncbi:hypothetical protein LBMAG56_24100 [Verrucomicrobiota bacterium]|nr:hypothetical protein LBMAG56_24100 [Verrucomicrobiota bacterium]